MSHLEFLDGGKVFFEVETGKNHCGGTGVQSTAHDGSDTVDVEKRHEGHVDVILVRQRDVRMTERNVTLECCCRAVGPFSISNFNCPRFCVSDFTRECVTREGRFIILSRKSYIFCQIQTILPIRVTRNGKTEPPPGSLEIGLFRQKSLHR